MSPKWKTFIKNFFKWLGILLLALVIAGAFWWPQAVKRPLPMIDGEISLPGLDGPVDVYRDPLGVPHIYATTTHDLFMVQGYVQAQDRFWQMDFQRHTGMGRLSELMGSTTLSTDKFLQTVGWERVTKQEMAMLNNETIVILEAFSEGVNAYIEGKEPADLSVEYNFIGLLNAGYEIKPWEPLHTMVWGKAMAWDLRSNMSDEITRAKLTAFLTPDQIDDLYPAYPSDMPIITQDEYGALSSAPTTSSVTTDLTAFLPAFDQTAQHFNLIDTLLSSFPSSDLGSNNWVIGGALTDTGMPYLANDMHLPANIPHIWTEVGLHCVEKNASCPYDVTGVTFAATPGVVVGHNDFIAWGYTNNGNDVADLYIEKINPDNPTQYEYNGEWVDMEVITETIRIGADETEEIQIRITQHGPIISDTFGSVGNLAEESDLDIPEHYAISLRWTALEPIFPFQAILGFNKAQNYEEFRQAAQDFGAPAQNIVYADIEGNIAYQMPGNHPIRNEGHTGLLPVPGWTDEYEWQGYIPFEELPTMFNPSSNFIASANNTITGVDYPYQLIRVYDYGQRADRIVDMILTAPGPIDIAYIQRMHGDNYNANAARLIPLLLEIEMNDEHLNELQDFLAEWDYQQPMDSTHAVLFEVFWKNLVLATFDELPEGFLPSGSSRWISVVSNLIDDPNSDWWDDQNTPEIETRDDIFKATFAAAVEEAEDLQGSDPAQWNWGELHTITFKHEVMNSFPLINSAFNQGPFKTSGGSGQINNMNWRTDTGSYKVDGSTPSQRLIVDLNNLANSLLIHPTGQSGHVGSPHYVDMAPLWANIEYGTLYWDLDALMQDAEGVLHFTP